MTEFIAFLKTLKTIVSLVKKLVDFIDTKVQESLDKAYEARKKKIEETIGKDRAVVESDKPDEVKDEELRDNLRRSKK